MSKNTKGILDTINSINKWKTRVIVWLCGIAIAAILIVLMVLTMGARVEEIIKSYETLSGSPQNSKQQFATRGTIITYDDKGRPTIQLATAVNEQDGAVNGIGDTDPGTPGGDGDSGGSGEQNPPGDCDADNHNSGCECTKGNLWVTYDTVNITYPYDIYCWANVHGSGTKIRKCIRGDHGFSRLKTVDVYNTMGWAAGSKQKKVRDWLIKQPEYRNEGGYAVYEDKEHMYFLTALSQYNSTFLSGAKIKVTWYTNVNDPSAPTASAYFIVIDSKAHETYNESWDNCAAFSWKTGQDAGHYYEGGNTMNYLELVRDDGTNNEAFSRVSGVTYNSDSRIIKIQCIGQLNMGGT